MPTDYVEDFEEVTGRKKPQTKVVAAPKQEAPEGTTTAEVK